jgi:phosphatidylserine decarboxylase precursor
MVVILILKWKTVMKKLNLLTILLYVHCTAMVAMVPQKQVAVFYESKERDAQIVREPVEWPVRVVYSDTLFGSLLRKGVDLWGHVVTASEARKKNSTDPKVVKGYIDHYLNFYKGFINMDQFVVPNEGFKTFNEWFIRNLKSPEVDRPLENNTRAIVSPADSKLLIIPDLTQHTQVTIKEQRFDVASFLQDAELAKKYEHGVMMIFRLAPYDYHRYHFPFDCFVSAEKFITGLYHSVNPRAFMCGVKPLTVNKRSYEILTPYFIDRQVDCPVIMSQVGATAVASIVNTFMDYDCDKPRLKYRKKQVFIRGNELGYFQFGGSTLVMLFPPNTIKLDEQIVNNSLNGYETAVKVRETVAHWQI